jgi:hypothetical protein
MHARKYLLDIPAKVGLDLRIDAAARTARGSGLPYLGFRVASNGPKTWWATSLNDLQQGGRLALRMKVRNSGSRVGCVSSTDSSLREKTRFVTERLQQ